MTTNATFTALIALFIIGTAPSAVAQPSEEQQELAAENFMEADADADGALTLSEFTTLIDLNAADNIGRAAMVKRSGRYGMVFERIDTNADGLVTPEEVQELAAQAKG
ncbi:MAG: hypothetical protein ACFBSD_10000 [Paracoccaceae bacterium]